MLTVRAAETEDASAIARVHVDTWQSTYGGLLPQSYLDGLTVQNRTINWIRLIERGGAEATTLVSEDHDRRVVGFVSGGPLRARDPRFQAEISSLYVLRSHQREGHGRRLFMALANRLAESGLKGMLVWVLADNPNRRFYERLGGALVAETTRVFAGVALHEVGFGWAETPCYG